MHAWVSQAQFQTNTLVTSSLRLQCGALLRSRQLGSYRAKLVLDVLHKLTGGACSDLGAVVAKFPIEQVHIWWWWDVQAHIYNHALLVSSWRNVTLLIADVGETNKPMNESLTA